MLFCHQLNPSSRFCQFNRALPQPTTSYCAETVNILSDEDIEHYQYDYLLFGPGSTYGAFSWWRTLNIPYLPVPSLSIFRCASDIEETCINFSAHASPFNLIHPALEHAIPYLANVRHRVIFHFSSGSMATIADMGLWTQKNMWPHGWFSLRILGAYHWERRLRGNDFSTYLDSDQMHREPRSLAL